MVLYLPFQGTPALLSLDTAKPPYSDVDDESLHVYHSAQKLPLNPGLHPLPRPVQEREPRSCAIPDYR